MYRLRFLPIVAILLFAHSISVQAQTKGTPKKVLLVLSGYGKDKGKTRPGFEMDEYAQAWWIFKINGLSITVASPKGGPVEPDKYNVNKPYNQLLLKDREAVKALLNTQSTAAVKDQHFDGVFIVGGKGAMFDLPVDPHLQDLLAALASQHKSIGAVCHGPAAFAYVKTAGGIALVKDREVSGFTNAEEKAFGKEWTKQFPFLLEDQLKAAGGKFAGADIMLPQTSVSDFLITGQNPYSTLATAEALVKHMGLTPVPRETFADERSMDLVQAALLGQWDHAKKSLDENPAHYDLNLLSAYAYYRLILAQEDAQIQTALQLNEWIMPHHYHESMYHEIAKGYLRINEKAKAKAVLNTVLQKTPNHAVSQQLLESLN